MLQSVLINQIFDSLVRIVSAPGQSQEHAHRVLNISLLRQPGQTLSRGQTGAPAGSRVLQINNINIMDL